MDPTSNFSIHNRPEYVFFDYTLNWAILVTIVPLLYVIPTICVMFKVYHGYRSQKTSVAKMTLDGSMFRLLIGYFCTNILFFFADFCRFNLPSSGLLTSWCAQLPPNHFFAAILMLTDYLNYCVVILPFMVTVIRVTILLSPNNHQQIRNWLMSYFICPFLLLVPLLSVLFLIPALGYCKQLGPPFEFGSVYIYYTGAFLKLRSAYFLLALSVSITSLSSILSIIMTLKLRSGPYQNASSHTKKLTKKAERSLSVTMISAIVPMTTNTLVSVTTIWFPPTVMMPWLLYLTHPVFREKPKSSDGKEKGKMAWNTSQVSSAVV